MGSTATASWENVLGCELCTSITMDGETTVDCRDVEVTSMVKTVRGTVDALLCDVFSTVAPLTVPPASVVVIAPDGNLHVLGSWIYDCPERHRRAAYPYASNL